MNDDEQERFLDEGLRNIKAQSFHIHNTIDKNNLRQCLKETNLLLCELRTSNLTPKNYYHLYTSAFDEMQHIENYFKEEIRRGRRVKDLYESVQQAQFILPRIYLLITAGSIYMEMDVRSTREIIFDLLQMVKGVQNPTRGLFTRYYLLKMIKNKLPDKGNQYETENGSFGDTIKFILQNWEEMNRLWIRLSTGCVGSEKTLREKERNELKIWVGENITRLSSWNGLTLELYQNEVWPRIINILLESKDQLSQQYLMECIILAFPDDFNIQCMKLILDTSTKLNQSVNVKSLYISLMEKLARFVGNAEKGENDIVEAAEKIFGLLKESIDNLIQSDAVQAGTDEMKLIELQVAFMKFTIKCSPKNDKLATVNHILSSTANILNKYSQTLDSEGIRLIGWLLAAPLESDLSLFEMKDFPTLMKHLDFSSRTTLSLRVIESWVNGTCKEVLDSVDKMLKLLQFINPLLEDSSDSMESDPVQFEYEQNTVEKFIFVVKSSNPETLLNVFIELKNVFSKGGVKRKRYTLPSLASAIINLCYQVSNAMDCKNNLVSPAKQTPIFLSFISNTDLSEFVSNEKFYNFMLRAYTTLNETITLIAQDLPEVAFKLYLEVASQVNSILSDREHFEEACASFINAAMTIFQEGKYESDIKCSMLNEVNGTLLETSILSKDFLTQLIGSLFQSAQVMVKRGDQCNAMLSVSHLYYSLLNDTTKVVGCIVKAKKFADFAMTNPTHLNWFVIILNKIMFFIEQSEGEIFDREIIEDIIETIKNHIQTIKTENASCEFLPPIEKYFERTLSIIKERAKQGKKKIYSEISLI